MPPRKSTARFYQKFLRLYVKPKWGDYSLTDVKTFAVTQWLQLLTRSDGKPLAPKTKKNIRSLMHILYDCALRWGLVPLGINPFGKRLVPIKNASMKKKRRSLTLEQFNALLRHRLVAVEPFRTMVISDICLGLRCSELFALKWSDFDWQNLAVDISRGVVHGIFDRPKSDSSEALLPLAAELAEILWSWKRRSPFKKADDLVFASPFKGGKAPYDPYGIQEHRLRRAGRDIGFGDDLGWHNLRHTYRTLMGSVGTPVDVQRALMRHKDRRQTLEYGETLPDDRRKANNTVVKLIFKGDPKNGRGRK